MSTILKKTLAISKVKAYTSTNNRQTGNVLIVTDTFKPDKEVQKMEGGQNVVKAVSTAPNTGDDDVASIIEYVMNGGGSILLTKNPEAVLKGSLVIVNPDLADGILALLKHAAGRDVQV